MKKKYLSIPILLLFTLLFSCNDKKLTEVVEVPLPVIEEKVVFGSPDDVKADQGSFQLEKPSLCLRCACAKPISNNLRNTLFQALSDLYK